MGMSVALVVVLLSCLIINGVLVISADPDPINDYCIADPTIKNSFINGLPCKNPASVTSADFHSSLFKAAPDTSNPLGIALGFAAGATFPALNTQGLTLVKIDYAKSGGFVPPHVHPRASEIIYVIAGEVEVGLIDTSGKFFNATLFPGDLFVFPRGLIHYQSSVPSCTSLSLSALNSQNPGLSLVASALFGSTPGIPDSILAKTLSITPAQVDDIKKAFGGH